MKLDSHMTELEKAWLVIISTLRLVGGHITDTRGDAISLKLKHRGEHDFLWVAKRYGPDGTQEVIFGSGSTGLDGLRGLEVAMDQGKWRPDKWQA